jgi:GTPase involved in cell partitioning and DNA repair
MKELEEYNPELIDKDIIISVSKSDLLDDELKKEISDQFPENKNHFSFLELPKKVGRTKRCHLEKITRIKKIQSVHF